MVTTDFQEFVDGVQMNYHEVYDFYQIAVGNKNSQCSFSTKNANGGNNMITYRYNRGINLLLTPKSAEYLPEWILANLMKGYDDNPEAFFAFNYEKDKHKDD